MCFWFVYHLVKLRWGYIILRQLKLVKFDSGKFEFQNEKTISNIYLHIY